MPPGSAGQQPRIACNGCILFLSWHSMRSDSVQVSPSAPHSLDNQILLILLDFFLFIPFVTYINSVSYQLSPEPLRQPPGIPASNPSPRYMVCTCQVTSQKQIYAGASLVVQRLRICLPGAGDTVWSLVQEDLTCLVCHKYRAPKLQLLKPDHLEPMLRHKWSHCKEKPVQRNEE